MRNKGVSTLLLFLGLAYLACSSSATTNETSISRKLTPKPTRTVTRSPAPKATSTSIPVPVAVVKNEEVNIRAGPGVDYEIVRNAYEGQQLSIYGRNNDASWLQIDDVGEQWIWAPLVNFSPSAPTSEPQATQTSPREETSTVVAVSATEPGEPELEVVSGSVNLRSGPGTNYSVLDYLYQGDRVEVIARTSSGEWFNIRTRTGQEGWLAASVSRLVGSTNSNSIPVVGTVPALPAPAPSGGSSGSSGSGSGGTVGCCKICRTGKACGNSCIRRSYNCHQPPGCACNGAIDFPPVALVEDDLLFINALYLFEEAMCQISS